MLCKKHVCLVCNFPPSNNKCCLMGPQNCRHLGHNTLGLDKERMLQPLTCWSAWGWDHQVPVFFSLSAWSSARIAVPIWASWDGEESIDKAMGQLCGCQLTAAHFNIHRASIAWWRQKPKKSVGQVAAFTADCKPSGVAKEAAVWGPDNAPCLTLWLWQRLWGLRFSKASLSSRA